MEDVCSIITFQARKLDSRCSGCCLDKDRKAVCTWRKVRVAKNGERMTQGKKRTKHKKPNF